MPSSYREKSKIFWEKSNPTEDKICFSHFSLFWAECEKLFCKTNINLLKLIKQLKIKIVWNDNIQLNQKYVNRNKNSAVYFALRDAIKTIDNQSLHICTIELFFFRLLLAVHLIVNLLQIPFLTAWHEDEIF